MILCLIILIAGVILTIIGAIAIYKTKDRWDFPIWPIAFAVTGVVSIIVSVLLLIIMPIENNRELNIFISQKEYIENYKPTSEYDAVAI